MPEHEHDDATDATGHDTAIAEGEADAVAASPPREPQSLPRGEDGESEEDAEGEQGGEQSMFGGLGPAEAARRRWERERSPGGTDKDPRVGLAAGLFKKAEKGDMQAYKAWKELTDELESERLARDGADGHRAWEQLTPLHRRALLALLDGGELREGEGGTYVIAPRKEEEVAVAEPGGEADPPSPASGFPSAG